jgi:hypothetical protein
MPPCKNSAASGFPAPLVAYVDVDTDGLPTFCYPKQAGSLLGAMSCIDRAMTEAMSLLGPEREEALKRLAAEIRRYREEHDTICAQWDEALARRRIAAEGSAR